MRLYSAGQLTVLFVAHTQIPRIDTQRVLAQLEVKMSSYTQGSIKGMLYSSKDLQRINAVRRAGGKSLAHNKRIRVRMRHGVCKMVIAACLTPPVLLQTKTVDPGSPHNHKGVATNPGTVHSPGARRSPTKARDASPTLSAAEIRQRRRVRAAAARAAIEQGGSPHPEVFERVHSVHGGGKVSSHPLQVPPPMAASTEKSQRKPTNFTGHRRRTKKHAKRGTAANPLHSPIKPRRGRSKLRERRRKRDQRERKSQPKRVVLPAV